MHRQESSSSTGGGVPRLPDAMLRTLEWMTRDDQTNFLSADPEVCDAAAVAMALKFVTQLRAQVRECTNGGHSPFLPQGGLAVSDRSVLWIDAASAFMLKRDLASEQLSHRNGEALLQLVSEAMGDHHEVSVPFDRNDAFSMWIAMQLGVPSPLVRLDGDASRLFAHSKVCAAAFGKDYPVPPCCVAVRVREAEPVQTLRFITAGSVGREPSLYFCTVARHERCLDLLLHLGARVNDCLPDERSILDLAVNVGDVTFYDTLKNRGANLSCGGTPALFEAATRGDEAMVRRLHADGVPIVAHLPTYGSAMQVAAGNGHLGVMRFMESVGVDVHHQSASDHGTALHRAAKGGHLEVVRFLVCERGTTETVNHRDDFGHTPLLNAVSFYGSVVTKSKIVRILCDAGAKVTFVNRDGMSPMTMAASLNLERVLREFHDAGVNILGRDNARQSVLHIAAGRGFVGITKLMIELGANVDQVDDRGRTPLDIATANRHDQVVRLLRSK